MHIFTNKTWGHLKMIYIFVIIILGETVQMIATEKSLSKRRGWNSIHFIDKHKSHFLVFKC